jgi:class 3 adenylate cyclase
MAHHAPAMDRGLSPRALALACLAGLGLCLAASASSAAFGRPPEVFLPVGISGAMYVVSGFLVARRRPANRIGYLLMLIGVAPPLSVALSYQVPVTKIFNDAFESISPLLVAFVLLSFPSGHLAGRAERITLSAVSAIFAIYAMAVLVTLEPAVHDPRRCPPCVPNPLRIADLSVFPYVTTVSNAVVVVTGLAVAILAARRWYRASGAARRVLAPVLFGGIVTAIGYQSTSVAFLSGGGPARTAQILISLQVLVPIGLAVTFIRVYAARGAVAGAVVQLGASPSMEGLEAALRRASGDSDLVVGRWSEAGGAYLDREGKPIDAESLSGGRSALRLERNGRPLAVVVHDNSLEVDPALVLSVADAVRFAVDTTELRDRLRASGGDVAGLPEGDVTFLFGDLEGSTELLSSLGGAYVDVLVELRRTVRETADRYMGRVVDARADECFLAFGDPVAAVAAALEIQRRLATAVWPAGAAPLLRVGLHRGTPSLTLDGYVGIDVHRAARVMSAANGGQILASGALARAVIDRLPAGATVIPLGSFTLKGIAEPEDLYQIAGRGPARDAPPRAELADRGPTNR